MTAEVILCRVCNGQGKHAPLGGISKSCDKCNGVGWIESELKQKVLSDGLCDDEVIEKITKSKIKTSVVTIDKNNNPKKISVTIKKRQPKVKVARG